MSRRRLRTQHGTTLVESIVALGLFAIGAGAVGSLLTQHIRQQVTNGTSTTAVSLAEQQFELLRGLNYDDIAGSTTVTAVDGMTYTIRTTATSNVPAPNMKQIEVQVSWTEPKGPQVYTGYAIYTAVKR
jgi:type II secretory pathway pseudopilin PulG